MQGKQCLLSGKVWTRWLLQLFPETFSRFSVKLGCSPQNPKALCRLFFPAELSSKCFLTASDNKPLLCFYPGATGNYSYGSCYFDGIDIKTVSYLLFCSQLLDRIYHYGTCLTLTVGHMLYCNQLILLQGKNKPTQIAVCKVRYLYMFAGVFIREY